MFVAVGLQALGAPLPGTTALVVGALEYYFFGDALAGASTWVQVVLVCAGVAWMLFSFNVLRRRALGRPREGSASTGSRIGGGLWASPEDRSSFQED